MIEELARELARLDVDMDPEEFLPDPTKIETEHITGDACLICRGEVTADNATVVGLWGSKPGPNGEGHIWACVPDCALECLALQDKVRGVEPPEDRSYAAVHKHYCDNFPLYREYWAVVEEHSDQDAPITVDRGGISTVDAARIALERIGKPARDADDAHWAYAYVRQLGDEVAAMADPATPTITSVLLDHFLPSWGRIPTLKEWLAEPEVEQNDTADQIAERLASAGLIGRVVKDALPALLVEVIEEDARLRATRRHDAELDRERMLHARGEFDKSAFPRGAFLGLPVDERGDGELGGRAMGAEGRADVED
ncbi:MAG TPA: hypothetical protein VGX25_00620 [Actinophytocola sp.]|uniref:hypothetical protein n=1 Tax=Actinophytocola sp. TaxID=1872138 RepID=UPI002DDD3C18|nr:hypothetical protein [Actinophytocola sp.]HEV2777882.1 hypothetical protein [Actinophytocola sp.]